MSFILTQVQVVSNPFNPTVDANKIGKAKFSTKGKSRGYGLSNVKKIVKKYKGIISIEHSDDIIKVSLLLKNSEKGKTIFKEAIAK